LPTSVICIHQILMGWEGRIQCSMTSAV